jgi:exosome complex exonuclease RRP6
MLVWTNTPALSNGSAQQPKMLATPDLRESRPYGLHDSFPSLKGCSRDRIKTMKQHLSNRYFARNRILSSTWTRVLAMEEQMGRFNCSYISFSQLMLRRYNHPYSTEIEQASYPEAVHRIVSPLPYMSPADSQAIFVDTREGVEAMLSELRQSTEIAIDLEHHDLHSYVGLVCLMQISTRQKDWIIDTLVPWREDLQILNEVFADPKILKVFQGSTMDMIWLQRDLGLYVVGLFDTFHASTALGFRQRSLKYLLERFCSFHAEKKYQMADWRIRPILREMLDYARSDTHYLLFIYDNLRNMLLEASSPDNDLIDYVLDESRKEALQRYERPMYDSEKGLGSVGWLMPLARRSIRFTPEQFGVYRAVHEWRDRVARASDEGVAFIMTQATVFAIAEAMPTTVPALFSVTNPVSKAISTASQELVEIIKMGKLAGREGPTVAEVMQENEAVLLHRRSTKRPAKFVQQGQGDDATSHKLDEHGEIGSNANRSYISRLWGTMAKPFMTTAARLMAPLKDAQRLVLPLPPLDDASFTSPAQPLSLERAVESTTQPSPHTNGSSGNAKSDDIFILKEMGRVSKRKAGPAELDSMMDDSLTSGLDANADYSALGSLSVESAPTTETKARRREEKRQRKAIQDKAANHDAPTEPFDYANANSMLHAKIDPHQPSLNGAAGAQAQFNPYTKGLDGPQGHKRARKETAGKSFTFQK